MVVEEVHLDFVVVSKDNNILNQRGVDLVVKECLVDIPPLGFDSHWEGLFRMFRFLLEKK